MKLGDPERPPVTSSDSELISDDDINLSEEDEDYGDSNYSEEDDTNSINTEEEEEDGGNYIVKSDGDTEYLVPLDDMNEEELEELLEELEITAQGGNVHTKQHQMYMTTGQPDPATTGHLHQQTVSSPKQQQHSDSLLYPSLHVLEITFYFCAFWMGAGYSLYRFYYTSRRWAKYLPLTATPGSMWGRQRDDTDIEWYVWPTLLLPYLHYALLHAACATVVRLYAHKHLCLLYIVSSVLVLYWVVGSIGLIMCLTVPSLMFTVLLTRNKQMLWVAWCLILLLFNVDPVASALEHFMSPIPEGDYKVSVMVAWIILRSLSYSLETCDADPDNNMPISKQLLTLFAYCLYLPFLFTGPYIPYVDFMTGLNAAYRPWNRARVGDLLLQAGRFMLWMAVANFLLYHFYAHSLQWSPQLFARLNNWSMAGFLYFLILFFVIKYVVLYGIPGVIASIEGYNAPPPPQCVIILCRFSELWNKFDKGLYKFMTRHIYLPWVAVAGRGFGGKLQATGLVFTFVYVWHGVTPQVMLWAGINFLGVTLEKCADTLAAREDYQAWEQRVMSARMRRRYYGVLSMLLLVPSVTALAIFLSSIENAKTIGHTVFVEGFPHVTLLMMFFMFCIAQISFEVHNWKVRRGDKSIKVK